MLPNKVKAYASDHLYKLVESNISHADMLGLIPDDQDTKFHKHDVDAKEIDKINHHLADQRELYIDKDENPVTADDISLDAPPKKGTVCAMRRKNERMSPTNYGKSASRN